MPLADDLDLEALTPARLWPHLDLEERQTAALSLFTQSAADAAVRIQAHDAIARALRFRAASVRKLPAEKKAGYLARLTRLDEVLAAGLIQSLHLEHRRPLLAAFLDALAIPHKEGLIADDHELTAPTDEALAAAAASLFAAFPERHVELYLASMVSVDPANWGGLRPVLAARRGAGKPAAS